MVLFGGHSRALRGGRGGWRSPWEQPLGRKLLAGLRGLWPCGRTVSWAEVGGGLEGWKEWLADYKCRLMTNAPYEEVF